MDRSVYPVAAQIHATITDHRLNIDPTSDDVWTWNTGDGAVYYMLDASNDYERGEDGAIIDGDNNPTQFNVTANNAVPDVCSGCKLTITSDDVINSVDIGDRFYRAPTPAEDAKPKIPAQEGSEGRLPGTNGPNDPGAKAIAQSDLIPAKAAIPATMWVTVTEDAPNAGTFTTTNNDNDSTLRVSDTAQRGASATIEYDGDVQGIVIQHSVASIDIASPDDVWTSGLDISIVLVDGDANKNSLSSDDISLTDASSIIPTLVTGDPFTLGEIKSDLTTWVGWKGTDNPVLDDILENLNAASPEAGHYYNGTNDADSTPNAFIVKDLKFDDHDDDAQTPKTWADGNNTATNAVVVQQSAEVESFSERAILSFNAVTHTDAITNLNGITGTTSNSTTLVGIDFIVIDLDDKDNDSDNAIDDLRASLINTNDTSSHGFNMINYNVGALGATPTNLVIMVTDTNDVTTNVATITLGSDSGYEPIDDDTLELLFGIKGDAYVAMPSGFTQLKLNFDADALSIVDDHVAPIVIDFFSFGFKNNGQASDERIANQIIRLELEENGSDTGSLEGSLEYVMINQLNIDDIETYQGITPVGQDVSFIVIEDRTGSKSPSVTYLDVDTNGAPVQVSAQEDAPSHSAVVSLNVDSFKTTDTVRVTLEDLDLNVNSGLIDIYTVVDRIDAGLDYVDANQDAVGEAYGAAKYDGVELGRLLDITFNDERWMDHSQTDQYGKSCTDLLKGQDPGYNLGLADTIFNLRETGAATGIFVGTFPIPAEFCSKGEPEPDLVTGLDIEVNYVDFRDQSGETTEVGDSAGVKASTGSVALDRTVYPVPFGVTSDFTPSSSTTPSESNTKTRSLFPIHQTGMDGRSGLQDGEFLSQGDLIVYVTVTDPDFDVSASGRDSIAIAPCYVIPDDNDSECRAAKTTTYSEEVDRSPVTIYVIRGSEDVTIDSIGGSDSPIDEIAPDAGIFESAVTIRYNMGPDSSLCPSTGSDFDVKRNKVGDLIPSDDSCILQGDILQVEYNDPTDASGQSNTVTDSATFDLRNGVLQSDKSVYIIGSDMILTLIEPDFDLDSSQNETYDLDLIKWSSSAATVTMGDADGEIGVFDPEPLSFRETGPSTGIFQIVIEIPEKLGNNSLQRGEEIDLEYTDWGPSGSDYVGDQDEDIRLTVFTSNFGATIDLDQKVYTWTDKVYITVVAPDHNFDNNLIDEIGESDEDPLRVATKGYDLDNYRLVETGFDTGIFTGEVILTGFDHPVLTGSGEYSGRTSGNGPTDGLLETPSDGGLSVSYEFSEDETVFTSSIIRWNIGDVQWLEASYPASGTGVLRVIDPDMNLNPEAVDNFDVNVKSDTDASGITLTVTETNEATGIFEGTIFFTTTGGSSGHRLRVSEGDTVTADYSDDTLPSPYTTGDSEGITSTTIIGTIVPPLERAPATSLRIVDTFGSSIDAVSIDQQVQITADLSNGQDRDQDFAYLIQIQNSEGVTVSLSWIAGSLSPGQSFSPSASWTPTSVGTYTVTAFVWESIDNPTALSPPLTIDVSVN